MQLRLKEKVKLKASEKYKVPGGESQGDGKQTGPINTKYDELTMEMKSPQVLQKMMTVRTGCTEREVENNYVNHSNLAGEPVAFAETNK